MNFRSNRRFNNFNNFNRRQRRRNNNVRRRFRNNGRRLANRFHSMIYTVIASTTKSSSVSLITASHLGLDTTRVCRTKYIRLSYYSPSNLGVAVSYTIESFTSSDDAVNRSPPLFVSALPRTYTLWTPSSTDFAYITDSQHITDISTYDPTGTSRPAQIYFTITVCMEYKLAQPRTLVLGNIDNFESM